MTNPREDATIRVGPRMSAVVSAGFVLALGLPLYIPIPGFEAVPLLAQGAAIAAAFLLLPAQLAADMAARRPGSSVRLGVFAFVLAAGAAWVAGAVTYGPTLPSLLSLINWIALCALIVGGQVLLSSPRRATALLRLWTWSYVVASTFVVAYLGIRFGGTLVASANRGPFQLAVREIFPTWPNYFGTALAVAICYPFARVLTRGAGRGSWLALAVLFATLLLTFSRTALLASGTATLTMAAITGRARRFLPFAVVIAIAGALIPAVRFQFLATFVSGTSQQLGVFERYALVTEALHIWREHPLFGIGFGQFEHFANVSRLVEHGGFLDATVGSVHNEYVTTLLKGGLLVASGFVAALVMAFRVFRRAVRSPVAEVRILGLASIGIAVSLTIAGLTAESFRTLSVSAPFWALIGALSVPQPNRGSGKSATHIVPDRPWREAR